MSTLALFCPLEKSDPVSLLSTMFWAQGGPLSAMLCKSGEGQCGQSVTTPLTLLSGPGGCFSHAPEFWDFHSEVFSMAGCLLVFL